MTDSLTKPLIDLTANYSLIPKLASGCHQDKVIQFFLCISMSFRVTTYFKMNFHLDISSKFWILKSGVSNSRQKITFGSSRSCTRGCDMFGTFFSSRFRSSLLLELSFITLSMSASLLRCLMFRLMAAVLEGFR